MPASRARNLSKAFWRTPGRDWLLIGALAAALALRWLAPAAGTPLVAVAALAALPTLIDAADALRRSRINIDVFNAVALGVSFATREYGSAAFIGLMLASARILEWRTESRTRDAVTSLLALKPQTASREIDGRIEEIQAEEVRQGDMLIVRAGARVPADGEVTYGTAQLNESSVTGESMPVAKEPGDAVLGATLVESGMIKVRATRVGPDSTLDRMVALMRDAAAHKSRSERMADRFAAAFLPIVAVGGFIAFLVTRDTSVTASLFLVACADDMAVAIPLAMAASLGAAARRGVLVKGGEWLDALGKLRTLVLDKTGTLTYGTLSIRSVTVAPGTDGPRFWKAIASAEKFSEHPIGRALATEGRRRDGEVPDPTAFDPEVGGVTATVEGRQVVIGDEAMMRRHALTVPPEAAAEYAMHAERYAQTTVHAFVDGRWCAVITVADTPRPEAAASLRTLGDAGVKVIMFTGDNERIAADVSAALGIRSFKASMRPEDKVREIETLLSDGGPVGMVGDGINDAPVLARADVGIAMGGGGTAVAAEAADVVILTDDLSRLPEMVELGKRTASVVRTDMVIWFVSNLVGFALVFAHVLNPALAAFYNFATDFLPLINSARLFREGVAEGSSPRRRAGGV